MDLETGSCLKNKTKQSNKLLIGTNKIITGHEKKKRNVITSMLMVDVLNCGKRSHSSHQNINKNAIWWETL